MRILLESRQMKYKLHFLFIAMACSMATAAQSSHADSMKILTTTLRHQQMLTSQYIGFAAAPNAGWISGAWIATIATRKELTDLLKDRNPVVRVWAYKALLARNGAVSKKIAGRLLNDKKSVEVMAGCVVQQHHIRELLQEASVSGVRGELAGFDELLADAIYRHTVFEALKTNATIPRKIVRD